MSNERRQIFTHRKEEREQRRMLDIISTLYLKWLHNPIRRRIKENMTLTAIARDYRKRFIFILTWWHSHFYFFFEFLLLYFFFLNLTKILKVIWTLLVLENYWRYWIIQVKIFEFNKNLLTPKITTPSHHTPIIICIINLTLNKNFHAFFIIKSKTLWKLSINNFKSFRDRQFCSLCLKVFSFEVCERKLNNWKIFWRFMGLEELKYVWTKILRKFPS